MNTAIIPFLFRICLMEFEGKSRAEISISTNTPLSEINKLMTTDAAAGIIKRLTDQNLETVNQVQAAAQAMAPYLLQKRLELIEDAKTPANVKDKAIQSLMEMAGHTPIKRVAITRDEPSEKDYDGKDESSIRRQILEDLGLSTSVASKPVLH